MGVKMYKLIKQPFFASNIKPKESACVFVSAHGTFCVCVHACECVCVRVCLCVFLLYVGYETAGTAEFSTQE